MITVVLSVYNTGKYLTKAMDAILSQTWPDDEIILVDDGSTDGSGEICEQQAKRKPGIRVYHKENGGLSSARNYGIERAKGEYIIFPDPDDWVEPDYLEHLAAVREKYQADLSICGHYDHIDGKIRVWNAGANEALLNQEEALALLMRPDSYCGYAWNKLFSLKVIRDNQLRFDQELGMVQDLHFCVRYFQFCRTVAYDPKPLYHYNHDSGGVTASYSPLTPRKLSCFLTYQKIANLTRDTHPHIAEMAYSSLCHMSLQYIYIYYKSGMKDRNVLSLLQKNYAEYRRYFLPGNMYPRQAKRFCRVVPFSPWLYFMLKRVQKLYHRTFGNPSGTKKLEK
ncbi:MAG: glycosyltransferase family 2 protein [Clostridia bacterium]|nr:glycosyltransferase family 2 protein [Clostridia bacterium]